MFQLITVVVPYVALLVALLALGLNYKKQLWFQQEQIKLLHELERLEKNIHRLNDVSLGMGQRMLQLEQKLHPQLKPPSHMPSAQEGVGYTQAIHLFDKGMDAQSVAAACGISQTEAQLMALIRKQNLTAAAHTL